MTSPAFHQRSRSVEHPLPRPLGTGCEAAPQDDVVAKRCHAKFGDNGREPPQLSRHRVSESRRPADPTAEDYQLRIHDGDH